MTIKSLVTAGALALATTVSAAQAGPLYGLSQQSITGTEAMPAAHKHCFPLFGVRRVHVTGSSLMVFKRVIVGYRCIGIAVRRPKLRFPDPRIRIPNHRIPQFQRRVGL